MAAILYTLEKNIILKVEMAITAKKKKHSKTRKNISRRIIQKTKKYYKKYQKCQKGGSGTDSNHYVELSEIKLNQEVATAVRNLANQKAADIGTSNPRFNKDPPEPPPRAARAAHAAPYDSASSGNVYSTVANKKTYSESGHPVYLKPVTLGSTNNPISNSTYTASPEPPPRAAHAARYGSVRFLPEHVYSPVAHENQYSNVSDPVYLKPVSYGRVRFLPEDTYSTVPNKNPYNARGHPVYEQPVPLRSTNNGIKTNIYSTFLDARKQIHKNEVKKWQNRLGNITDFSKINIQNLADKFRPKKLSDTKLAMSSKSTRSRSGSRSGYRPSIKQKLSGKWRQPH
jgi:hypothetical protein